MTENQREFPNFPLRYIKMTVKSTISKLFSRQNQLGTDGFFLLFFLRESTEEHDKFTITKNKENLWIGLFVVLYLKENHITLFSG